MSEIEQLDELYLQLLEEDKVSHADAYLKILLDENPVKKVQGNVAIDSYICHDLAPHNKIDHYSSLFQCASIQLKQYLFTFPLHTILSIEKRDWMHNHHQTNSQEIGSIRYHNHLIRVIDLNAWWQHQISMLDTHKSAVYIMVINQHWGIYLPTLPELQTIKPDAVEWQSAQSENPWVLGRLKDRNQILIDGEVLTKGFEKQLSNKS